MPSITGCYWKNDSIVKLYESNDLMVKSVFVSGNDVYLAGSRAKGNGVVAA